MISVKVDTDPISLEISQAFDYPWSGESTFQPPTLPPLPEPYTIGLIVGPSGSGKTQLLKTLPIAAHIIWNPNKSIAAHFPSLQTAINRFGAVGLNSIPSWLRPFHVLSTGEQARAQIAADLIPGATFDEFTSAIDRPTAKSLCAAIRNYVDKNQLTKITFASPHRDIIDWLQPDWTFDTLTQRVTLRGSLQQPQILLRIHRCDWKCWLPFSHHHYLTGKIHRQSQCFLAIWDFAQVAFIAVLALPHPTLKNAFREHRLVVLPEYQGLGIGTILSDTIAEYFHRTGSKYYSRTIHPRIGQHRQNSNKWTPTRGNLQLQKTSKTPTQITNHWKTDLKRRCFSHQYTGAP